MQALKAEVDLIVAGVQAVVSARQVAWLRAFVASVVALLASRKGAATLLLSSNIFPSLHRRAAVNHMTN